MALSVCRSNTQRRLESGRRVGVGRILARGLQEDQMARATRELVYIGIKGHVLALDRGTGEEVWRAHLKGSGFVNVTLERGVVLAGTHGVAFALDPVTGRTLW